MWRCAVVVGRWRLQLGELSQSNQRLELSSTRLDETQRRLDSRLGVISKFFSSLLRSDGPDARSPGLCQQAEGRRIFAFLLRPFFSLFLLSLRSLLTLPASLESSQSILSLSFFFVFISSCQSYVMHFAAVKSLPISSAVLVRSVVAL